MTNDHNVPDDLKDISKIKPKIIQKYSFTIDIEWMKIQTVSYFDGKKLTFKSIKIQFSTSFI